MTFTMYYFLIGLLLFGSVGVEVLKEILAIDIFSDEKPNAIEEESELRDTLCDLYDRFGLLGLKFGWVLIVFVTCVLHIIFWPLLMLLVVIKLGKKMLSK